MNELELELLKKIVSRLEAQAGVSAEDRELRELHDLLMALELTRRAQPPPRKGLNWNTLLPLLVSLGILLGVIVATVLGVDVRGLL